MRDHRARALVETKRRTLDSSILIVIDSDEQDKIFSHRLPQKTPRLLMEDAVENDTTLMSEDIERPAFVLCLQLVADGTSRAKTAELLEIPQFHVDELLRQACRELDAVNVPHAIAVGMRRHLIE